MKLLKFLPALFILSTATYAEPTALSATLINEVYGTSMEAVNINSWHSYYLTNNTNTNASFKVEYKTCAPDKRANPCVNKIENFVLVPKQTLQNTYHFKGKVTFQNIGNHALIASTEITGAAYHKTVDQKNAHIS